MASLGSSELIIVFAGLVLLFGASRLPGRALSMGETARECRNGLPLLPRSDRPLTPSAQRRAPAPERRAVDHANRDG